MSATSPSDVASAPVQTDSGAAFRDTLVGVAATVAVAAARSYGIPLDDATAALVIGGIFGGASVVRKKVVPVLGSIFAGALSRLASR
jgi:divalent metal cation (Fe/Co/Zn/Cd) transporter